MTNNLLELVCVCVCVVECVVYGRQVQYRSRTVEASLVTSDPTHSHVEECLYDSETDFSATCKRL